MSEHIAWFKSTYSDGEGGDCLQVALDWRKSTYSDEEGGECVEVATTPRTVHIRDSKRPVSDPYLTVPSAAWSALVAYAREA